MLFNFVLIFISICTAVLSLRSEVNGVNIKYKISGVGPCIEPPVNLRLLSLARVSVNECLHQCAIRLNCAGLNYKRTFQLCDLFSGNGHLETVGNCLYIKRSDMVIENSTCNDDCDGEQVCDPDGKCIVIVNPECQYPEVVNGKPSGNMFAAGDTQSMECNSGYCIHGLSKLTCMENGTWDSIPECRKDCNESVFHHTDVEAFRNSSGSYAVLRCHTYYISNRTASPGNLITEDTVRCASNGSWIPNIDCIYIDNLSNVAWNKPASQSSTYAGAVAARGTDGIWDPDFSGGSSCTHTQHVVETAWWEVDLQQVYVIRRVKILNRLSDYFAGRFRQVTVTVGNFSNPTDICGVFVGPAVSGEEVQLLCDGAIPGQFVRLSKPNINHNLAVCEVGVYEYV